MSRGLLLVDVLNLTHAANANKPLTVGELPTQAIYGFLRSLRLAVTSFPQLTPVCLHDGRSWRHGVFEGYKASRNKTPTTASEHKMASLRQQVRPQLPYIRQALVHLGVRQVNAINLEADDLAGMMVRKSLAENRKVMLLTADKDWIQLVGPNVAWFDPIHDTRITLATIEAKLGVKSPRAFLEVKALMGDPSDDISGVGGIGEKGAKDLINEYGSVADFLNRSIEDLTVKLPKKFADLADSNEKQEIFARNMRLMDLSHPSIPKPADLRVNAGEFNPEAFMGFCDDLLFRSITGNFEDWIEPFRSIQ
jgi:5'-3' exonuclease